MMHNKKILFWNRLFWMMVGLFIIPMILYISLSESLQNNEILSTIIGFFILSSIIMLIIFRIGMVYNAYKIKRYGWMLSALILGDIFSIIFYFTILKKYANNL